jgi:hypothetical protein
MEFPLDIRVTDDNRTEDIRFGHLRSSRQADKAPIVQHHGASPEGGPSHPDIGWCRDYFAAWEPPATGCVYVNILDVTR